MQRTRDYRIAQRKRALAKAKRILRQNSMIESSDVEWLAPRMADNLRNCSCHLCQAPEKAKPRLRVTAADLLEAA
ncbi:MAG: hypothetical protein CMB36_04340 [Euryarchaeota archaeon]|nr:hypothetical protein [Euryarchaeota archaeon]|tara:strand:+ start:800 stop:1024 length:225 start_codon:yes stop_codon:yes gene_type:complete